MSRNEQSRLNTIDEIKDRLAKYPQVNYEATKVHVSVHPANGFTVSLHI